MVKIRGTPCTCCVWNKHLKFTPARYPMHASKRIRLRYRKHFKNYLIPVITTAKCLPRMKALKRTKTKMSLHALS